MSKLKYAILIILLPFVLASCLKDGPMKIPFQTYSPHNLADGWEIAEPAETGIDEEALKEVYKYVHEDDNLWQIRSLLVFRNNKLVAESYMKDPDNRTTPRAIWSCTKQVMGILTGIAVDKGLISVSDKISVYLPQISQYPEKKEITIENLLMMKSGIGFENDGHDGGPAVMAREEVSSSIDYIFGLKMHATPGTVFNYNDGDPHVLSAVLQEVTGKTTRDWAQEVLFDKIGITRLEWLNYKDGITFGGYGIKTTPRELGKFGQLMLNDGMWGYERVVSSEWIADMTSPLVSNQTLVLDSFGYMWWKDTQRGITCMAGRGGQFVFINRDKNLLVVMTSETNTSGDFNLPVFEALSIFDRINSIAE